MAENLGNAETVLAALKEHWGYEGFRSPQGEIVANLLQHRDSLVVLATGGGKSICFQLPALLKAGLTLVISPLLALIEDQVADLKRRGLPAERLHSALARRERQHILANLAQYRLLYLSPETLLSRPVWERLLHPELRVTGLMVDEAHCLVMWGDTFRPAYRRLGAVRGALQAAKPHHPPIAVAAFTATANPQAQAALIQCLQLQHPQHLNTSPYRPNLHLNVEVAWSPAARRARALSFIKPFLARQQSGLVYVRSRREATAQAAFFREQGWRCAPYHGGLAAPERRKLEADWVAGRLPFVVTTNAFGMGINKPDCRWVLHTQHPLTLADYSQEVGRGGRDGQPATALLLRSEPTGWLDPTDRQMQQFFQRTQTDLLAKAAAIAPKLPRRGEADTIAQEFPDGAVALGLLHSLGHLVWHTPFEYELQGDNWRLPPPDPTPLAEMQDFMDTRQCRWGFLIAAFGFPEEGRRTRCGVCDRCRR